MSSGRHHPMVLTILWIALLFIRGSAAQMQGPEFQVNTYTSGLEWTPSVAMDGSGNFVVVWASFQDGTYPNETSGIRGQRFDASFHPAGPEFQVHSHTPLTQRLPSIAANAAGDFVVVWLSDGQDGSGYGVFGQRYDFLGNRAGTEFLINSWTSGHQFTASVAMDDEGDFVVVWTSKDREGYGSSGVFGQRFGFAGSRVGNEFQVNSSTHYVRHPRVAMNGSGSFVVVWESSDQDGSSHGVFGRRYDPSGNPFGSEFQVNSYTLGRQSGGGFRLFNARGPGVALDDSDNVIIVWSSLNQDGSRWGVFGQRFGPADQRLGNEFQVNSWTTNYQYHPVVAIDGKGNFLVLWDSLGQDHEWTDVNSGASPNGVFGQFYDSMGRRIGREFAVNTHVTSSQQSVTVAVHAAGTFVAVWESHGQDGRSYGVFAREGVVDARPSRMRGVRRR